MVLREALASHVSGRGKRFPIALKARAVTLASKRRRAGWSWGQIGDELGIGTDTVRRWFVGRHGDRVLRPVEVVAERAARSVTVLSPGGFRVADLSLDEAAALLRAVG